MEGNDLTKAARIGDLLKERLLRLMPHAGKYPTAIKELSMARREQAHQTESCFYKPSLGVIIQGAKRSRIGTREYLYGENQCMIAGVDMPCIFTITKASARQPFLAVSLELDKGLLARLTREIQLPMNTGTTQGVSVTDADPGILDAFLRLFKVLERTEELPFLAPVIIREIHYRLLIGPRNEYMRRLNTGGTQSNQIASAVDWIREHYKEPLRVETLAEHVHMATSTFHRHFKEVTSLSPLQFHKYLRLHEAQRLMLAERKDATRASGEVGYESPTQFNREYKRLFGNPPHKSIARMR